MIGNKFLFLSILFVNNLMLKSKIMNKVKISSNQKFWFGFFHCFFDHKLVAPNTWRTYQDLVW